LNVFKDVEENLIKKYWRSMPKIVEKYSSKRENHLK